MFPMILEDSGECNVARTVFFHIDVDLKLHVVKPLIILGALLMHWICIT